MGRPSKLLVSTQVAAGNYDIRSLFSSSDSLLYIAAGHNGSAGNTVTAYLCLNNGSTRYRMRKFSSVQASGDGPDFFQPIHPIPLQMRSYNGSATYFLELEVTSLSGAYVTFGATSDANQIDSFSAHVITSTTAENCETLFPGGSTILVSANGGTAGTNSTLVAYSGTSYPLKSLSSSTNDPSLWTPSSYGGITNRTVDPASVIVNTTITGTGYSCIIAGLK